MILRAMLLVLCLLIGCKPAPQAAPPPPATTQADTSAAYRSSSGSRIIIDGQPWALPPLKLKLQPHAAGLLASLLSDDAFEQENSFWLEMELDIDSASQLPAATWDYQAPSLEDQVESPTGIALNDGQIVLQPHNVQATFSGDERQLRIQLQGRFAQYTETAAPTLVNVEATFVLERR